MRSNPGAQVWVQQVTQQWNEALEVSRRVGQVGGWVTAGRSRGGRLHVFAQGAM